MNGWYLLGIIAAMAAILFAIFARHEKGIAFAISTFIAMLATVVFVLIAVITPLVAKKNILLFEATKFTVETVGPITGYEDYTDEIESANRWLANAQYSLNTYGIFSKYYGSKISELTPIDIAKE